jgi:hypothetical protein
MARLYATKELLDRGFGKPSQHLSVDIEHVPNDLAQLSVQELADRAEAIAAAIRETAAADARLLPAAPADAVEGEVVDQGRIPVGNEPKESRE